MITALTLLLAPALAQSSDQEVRLDAQHFRPSVDAEHLLWTDVSRQDDDHAVAVRSTLSYAHLPYVYHPPGQAAPHDRFPRRHRGLTSPTAPANGPPCLQGLIFPTALANGRQLAYPRRR